MRSFRPSGLQSVSLIYGLLYFLFVLLASIPSTRGGIIGGLRPESVGLELALAQFLFLLFLVGCAATWQSELIAGMIFLLWCAFVCWWRSPSRAATGPVAGECRKCPDSQYSFWACCSSLDGLGTNSRHKANRQPLCLDHATTSRETNSTHAR